MTSQIDFFKRRSRKILLFYFVCNLCNFRFKVGEGLMWFILVSFFTSQKPAKFPHPSLRAPRLCIPHLWTRQLISQCSKKSAKHSLTCVLWYYLNLTAAIHSSGNWPCSVLWKSVCRTFLNVSFLNHKQLFIHQPSYSFVSVQRHWVLICQSRG